VRLYHRSVVLSAIVPLVVVDLSTHLVGN
jgi:hypothetical protein